jgi:hypothetical protein
MDSSDFGSGATPGRASVDYLDLSGLDKIVSIHAAGDASVVVRTADGRDIRITAWRNLSTGQYVADFERRSTVRKQGQELQVWSQTPAYRRCTADDLQSCLEAAVLEVDRVYVY